MGYMTLKIHAMCIAKNESDIIAQCLKSALNWSDYIYVYDNGSSDGTWEQILELSKEYNSIIPYKRDSKPFKDGLRAEIFKHYRANSSTDDWWCRLDADEFYIDDPRIFLAKVPRIYTVVWTVSFAYYFTDKDAELYHRDPSLYADDVPVEQKIRYYINHWSEPRFFRYRERLVWNNENQGFPNGICESPAYPVRMWLRHFQYRSPQQIEKRLETRRSAIGNGIFIHEAMPNWSKVIDRTIVKHAQKEGMKAAAAEYFGERWEERVVDASGLYYDAHDRRLVNNEDIMPQLPTFRSPVRRFASYVIGKFRASKPMEKIKRMFGSVKLRV